MSRYNCFIAVVLCFFTLFGCSVEETVGEIPNVENLEPVDEVSETFVIEVGEFPIMIDGEVKYLLGYTDENGVQYINGNDFFGATPINRGYGSGIKNFTAEFFGVSYDVDTKEQTITKSRSEESEVFESVWVDKKLYFPLLQMIEKFPIDTSTEEGMIIIQSNVFDGMSYTVINDEDTGLDWTMTIPDYIPNMEQVVMFNMNEPNLGNDHYTYSEERRFDAINGINAIEGYITLNIIMVEDKRHGNALQLDHIFDSSNPFYQRYDIKYAKIIDKAIAYAREQGLKVNDRIVVEGFSGGGVFAHKFALLYPEKVLAVVGGQCGGYLTMLEDVDGIMHSWPNGLADYEENMGKPLDKDAFNNIMKFIYIGSYDNECSYFPDRGTSYSDPVSNLYRSFGDADPIRLYNLIEFFRKNGYENYHFKIYEGFEHSFPPRILSEILEGIRLNKEEMNFSEYVSSEAEIKALTSEEHVKDMVHNRQDIRYKQK